MHEDRRILRPSRTISSTGSFLVRKLHQCSTVHRYFVPKWHILLQYDRHRLNNDAWLAACFRCFDSTRPAVQRGAAEKATPELEDSTHSAPRYHAGMLDRKRATTKTGHRRLGIMVVRVGTFVRRRAGLEDPERNPDPMKSLDMPQRPFRYCYHLRFASIF